MDACCAAYGVPLREPLNPIEPAEDQHKAWPVGSVIVINVLLNVACTYTTPCGTVRRSRFFLNSFLRFAGLAGAPDSTAPSFCSFATACSVSLRVSSDPHFGESAPQATPSLSCSVPSSWLPQRLGAAPCACGHWCASSVRARGGSGGAASRGSTEFQ